MKNQRLLMFWIGTVVAIISSFGLAHGAFVTYYDEAAFRNAAGTLTTESFETITYDSWIYGTRLPSPIPALDLDDDPGDPNDGPNYDLDGHFNITGNSIAYAPADELFRIVEDSSTVDGDQYLAFSPYYNSVLWGSTPNDQHPIITFDNFNNSGDSIISFGFYFYDYDPGSGWWIVMTYGDEYIPVTFTGERGNYFFGVVGDTYFSEVQFHTNQNGSAVKIDEILYGSDAPVPEPGTLLLLGTGLVGLAGLARKKLKE